MITSAQAHEIVSAYLAQMRPCPDQEGVTAELTGEQEHRFGWEFRYQSSTYVQTRDPQDMWVGTGPIVVDRRTGRVQELGGRQFGDTVGRYQERFDREAAASRIEEPLRRDN